eukprot:1158831-Pelagomonas_calceolata.AAC.1
MHRCPQMRKYNPLASCTHFLSLLELDKSLRLLNLLKRSLKCEQLGSLYIGGQNQRERLDNVNDKVGRPV